MSAKVKVTEYATEPELYGVLERVFGEDENDGVRWVSFMSSTGVQLTFFAPPDVAALEGKI